MDKQLCESAFEFHKEQKKISNTLKKKFIIIERKERKYLWMSKEENENQKSFRLPPSVDYATLLLCIVFNSNNKTVFSPILHFGVMSSQS